MNAAAALFRALERSDNTDQRLKALTEYFSRAPDRDKLWVLHFLSRHRNRRYASITQLRRWAAELAGIPSWLFDESYRAVGDLAETIALILPIPQNPSDRSLSDWMDYLKNTAKLNDDLKKERIASAWEELHPADRFIFNKILTGSLRPTISQNLVCTALSSMSGVAGDLIAHGMMKTWDPEAISLAQFLQQCETNSDFIRPYPFLLAHPLDDSPSVLGSISDWHIEWLWSGIRVQLIKQKGEILVWSRSEELLMDALPEIANIKDTIADGIVIDGQILARTNSSEDALRVLQAGTKPTHLRKRERTRYPAVFMAYDVLEHDGRDVRDQPFRVRRTILEGFVRSIQNTDSLLLSPTLPCRSWDDIVHIRGHARENGAEGLMLKRLDSAYEAGRIRGIWWKWQADPISINAVLMYAQAGHGLQSHLYTYYTLGVWDNGALVPCARTHANLTAAETKEIDDFVRNNTQEKFGPVRAVPPHLVFELAFNGIQFSKRHKSGVALQNPRILRLQKDKKAEQASTLGELHTLVRALTRRPGSTKDTQNGPLSIS